MNIGYLQDIFPKTSETFVYNEIKGLKKANDIKIFAIEREEGLPTEGYDVIYFKRSLLKAGTGALKAGLSGELLEKSAKEPYFHMIADYFSEFSKSVEILHRHFATNSIVYYLAKKLKVPYTLTTHAWDIFSQERYAQLDIILKKAAKVITISEYNKEYLRKNIGLGEEHIEVVRMGIDPERFSPLEDEHDSARVLSVGRLVEKKGFEYGIRAIKILTKKYPDINYTIVGDGPKKFELKGLIEELKLENNVRIAGKMPNETLLEEYKNANVVILPCVVAGDGDMDGIPVVLMEAMAMEKPVISTRISGIPELISHGEDGLLVEQRDPSALAKAIDGIFSGKYNAKDLGANGRRTITESYSLDRQVKRMSKLFEEVLSGGA